jgi:hypothetical protein
MTWVSEINSENYENDPPEYLRKIDSLIDIETNNRNNSI